MAKKSKKTFPTLILLAVVVVAVILGIKFLSGGNGSGTAAQTAPSAAAVSVSGDRASFKFQEGKLGVAYIDVGQGDSILIKSPEGKVMLIDSGEYYAESAVKNALDMNGIKKIDIVVCTHPHSDHIGCMDEIIKSYDIGAVYMPKASNNTSTFKNLLTAIKDKGLKVNTAKAGVSLDLGSGITAVMLAPNSSTYEDMNDYSAVIKLTYGKNSFLFTGDAGKVSEKEMLAKYSADELHADVLKVGHHGSRTASTKSFLTAVSPKYAVISYGKDNDYGHPHAETTERLSNMGIIMYKTEPLGTILATSDGTTISFNKDPNTRVAGASVSKESSSAQKVDKDDAVATVSAATNSGNKTVYITSSGKTYHKKGCTVLKGKEYSKTTVKDAEAAGYTPCKKCYGD